jgi:superfamily II DNA or RNA helicase
MSIRPEDFPFGFSADQRKLAETFVSNRQVELLERGPGAYARARVRIFKRTLEAWAERRDDGSPLRFECECPHVENEGTGCAHLFALCLMDAAAEAAAATPPKPEDDAPFEPIWAIDRARSHGSRKLWVGAFERTAEGALKPARVDASALVRAEGADDAILKLLQPSAGGRVALDKGGGFARPEGPWAVEDDAIESLAPLLVSTKRCVIDKGDGVANEPLVDATDKGPFEFVMRVVKKTPGLKESFSSVVGEFRRETKEGVESARALDLELIVLGRKPFLVADGGFAWIEAFDAYDWLKYFAKREGPEVPPGDVEPFLARLAAGGALPRLWLSDDSAPLPVVREAPTPTLSIVNDRGDATARLTFTYAEVPASAVGRDALVFDAKARRHLRRDLPAEEAAAAELLAAGAIEDLDVYGRYLLPEGPLDVFASKLLDRGFRIFVDGAPQRRSTGGRLRLVSGEDWFELRGGLEFGEETVPIPLVFDALKKGRRFVELKGGGQGLVPEEFAERWRLLDDLGVRKGEAIRLRKTQGLVLDALLAERSKEIEARPEDIDSMRDALAALRAPPSEEPPTTLKAELRPYQKDGLSWLAALDASGYGGCLADDMGLGKTVQTIALLLRRKSAGGGPHLVVVPRSLVFNWRNELRRFAPSLRVLDHASLAKDQRSTDFGDADVVITTYGIVRRDAEELSKVAFDWIVLDESQAIKNSSSQNSKAARLLKGRRRLVMTGTPIENRPEELWSQFEFLNPGMLGKENEFGRLARDDRTRLTLARVIRPLVLRRTKEQVAKDLPEKIEQIVYCELTPEQERVYEEILRRTKADVMERVERDGLGASKLHVLEALLRLRQAAAHAGLVSAEAKEAPSGKFEALLELLEEPLAAGRKALVFSQFPSVLKLLRPELVRLGVASEYIDGSTKDRETPVRRFQEDPNVSILLASLMVGGHGLNLTAADYVFILDPWWNPAVEAQAVARAHRIGRKDSVVALRLVSRGTVEEKMLALQEKKRALAENLLDASGPVADLSADDLLLLFTR